MRCSNGIPVDDVDGKTIAFSMACEKRGTGKVRYAPRKRHIMMPLIQPKMPCQNPSGSSSKAPVMAR